MVTHTFSARQQQRQTQGDLSLCAPGQPALHSDPSSKKQNQTNCGRRIAIVGSQPGQLSLGGKGERLGHSHVKATGPPEAWSHLSLPAPPEYSEVVRDSLLPIASLGPLPLLRDPGVTLEGPYFACLHDFRYHPPPLYSEVNCLCPL